MNILSFKKMRAYRSEGKIVAILSVTLPEIEGENSFSDSFNRFYTELYERLSSSVEKMKKDIGITKVTVDFEPFSIESLKLRRKEMKRRDRLIAIKRTVTVKTREGRIKTDTVDVFDVEALGFVR